jgi:hypothetical protein
VVVQSSCAGAGASDQYAPLRSCPRNADDAKTTSSLAGYCFNISLPPPSTTDHTEAAAAVSTNVSLTSIVDRSVVEVFVGTLPTSQPGPVISSGVFVDAGSSEATLELFCEGAAATVDATSWTLAAAEDRVGPLKLDDGSSGEDQQQQQQREED